jgi:DHA1 family tetracycline resistance protein-like MFS transporter
MSSSRSARVAFIFVTLVLDTLGIGLVIPVLPGLVGHFVGSDTSQASRTYGVFVAAYAAMQFVFSPILGGLSDRFGRRPVLLSSLAGAAADYLLLAFAPSLPWLFVGRLIAGLTGASFSTATAYIADVTPAEKRAQAFGLIGAAFGIGFVIGPALGGVLGDVNPRLPFYVAAGLNFANFLYGVFVLPESLSQENRRPFSWARANPLGALLNLRRYPMALGLTGTLICGQLAQFILQSVWALYTGQRFAFTARDVGLSLALVGVMSAVVQGGLVRAVMPRLGETRAVIVGLVIIPFSLGGIAGPALQSTLSRQVPPNEQGELQGSVNSLQSVTSIVGPILGTNLLAYFGAPTAQPRIVAMPFYVAAALQCIGLALALRLFARTPKAA